MTSSSSSINQQELPSKESKNVTGDNTSSGTPIHCWLCQSSWLLRYATPYSLVYIYLYRVSVIGGSGLHCVVVLHGRLTNKAMLISICGRLNRIPIMKVVKVVYKQLIQRWIEQKVELLCTPMDIQKN